MLALVKHGTHLLIMFAALFMLMPRLEASFVILTFLRCVRSGAGKCISFGGHGTVTLEPR